MANKPIVEYTLTSRRQAWPLIQVIFKLLWYGEATCKIWGERAVYKKQSETKGVSDGNT